VRLRPYQEAATANAIAELEKHDSTIVILPTGCGKTVVFSHIAKHFSGTGRVMVLAHREELIRQAADKLGRVCGIIPEIEMASEWADKPSMYRRESSPFIVSSIQTQISGRNGAGRMSRFSPDDFSLVIIDEAHHATADTYRRVIAHYRQNPKCKILGVTATPDRADETALGSVFKSVAYYYGIEDAVNDGWLTPIRQRVVVVEGLDFSAIKTTAGDLNQGELAEVMEFEENLHGIAHPAFELSRGRKMLVFAASVAHAERLAEIFNRHEAGCARAVSGKTITEERQATLRSFKYNELRILVNCGVFTEGFDEPSIQVVAMARPTKSRSLFTQMIGRGTRPLEGIVDGQDSADARLLAISLSAKPYVEVLDFAGDSGKHKLVSVADVLGGKYPPEVVAAAQKAAEAPGEARDISSLLEAAEKARLERAAEAEKKRQDEAAKRAAIRARANYHAAEVNPFDRTATPTWQPKWYHKKVRPSEKQMAMLQRLGHQGDAPSNMAAASALIDALMIEKGWKKKAVAS
jgi:superfamily II DNA or RNA helicase